MNLANCSERYLWPCEGHFQPPSCLQITADIEIGGTDQLFNCSIGRQLQESMGMPGQAVLCMSLLRGIDGSAKMSKSEGNIVGLTDAPEEMYGKVMSIPDALLPDYIVLTTDFSVTEKHALIESIKSGINPMQVKKLVAYNIVGQYHSQELAINAQAFFEKQFQHRSINSKNYQSVSLRSLDIKHASELILIDVCKGLMQVMSKSHLRRLVESGSVSVNGAKVVDPSFPIKIQQLPIKVNLGKREYFEILE